MSNVTLFIYVFRVTILLIPVLDYKSVPYAKYIFISKFVGVFGLIKLVSIVKNDVKCLEEVYYYSFFPLIIEFIKHKSSEVRI